MDHEKTYGTILYGYALIKLMQIAQVAIVSALYLKEDSKLQEYHSHEISQPSTLAAAATASYSTRLRKFTRATVETKLYANVSFPAPYFYAERQTSVFVKRITMLY